MSNPKQQSNVHSSLSSVSSASLWTSSSLSLACSGKDYDILIEDIYNNVKAKMKESGNGKRFNELNVKEQAIIVENEMSKMVNNESETMVKVHHNYWNILDAQLISHLSNKSMIKDNDSTNKVRFKEVKHQSNIDILLDVVSVGINEIMINSPIDLLNTKKLFFVKPFPSSLRPYIWNSCIVSSLSDQIMRQNTVSGAKVIAPSLDVNLSRLCQELLDLHFSNLSSRWMAGFIKDCIITFMKMQSMPFPHNDDETGVVKQLFFLVLPIIIVLNTGKDEREPLEELSTTSILFTNGIDDSVAVMQVTKALKATLGSSHMQLLSTTYKKGIDHTSPFVSKIMTILEEKDPPLHFQMDRMRISEGQTETSWTSFFDLYLTRGLSNLLQLETCLFIWDQCFITSFAKLLPWVMVSLLLANKDELISLTNLASGIDAFKSFCQTVTVVYMKRILLLHCSKELKDVFQLDQGFVQEEGKEGVLDSIYPRLLLSLSEVKNRAKLAEVQKDLSVVSRSASNVTVNDSNSVTINDSISVTDDIIEYDITEEDKRRLELADGIYIGQVNHKQLRHGHGKFIFNDSSSMAGHIYVGDWKNDIIEGHGNMTMPDGTKYVGEYSNGKMNGKGIVRLVDGDFFDCEFQNGERVA